MTDIISILFCSHLTSADKLYGDDLLDASKYKLSIGSDGSIIYFVAGSTTTFCDMDLSTFPFDVQTCFIRVISWTYPADQVHMFELDPVIDTSLYHTNGQWDLHQTLVNTSHSCLNFDLMFCKH